MASARKPTVNSSLRIGFPFVPLHCWCAAAARVARSFTQGKSRDDASNPIEVIIR
jgi:hypothetical protein